MNKSDHCRLFIALSLPAAVRENILRLIGELSGKLPGVRWTPRDNLHLTLKFLGETEADRIPKIQEVLDQAAGRSLPFSLRLEGLGAFPLRGRPRILWTGVGEGAEALVALAQKIDRELAPLGFAAEDRPYTPHLTLGRVKSGVRSLPPSDFAREIGQRQADSLGSLNVDMIVLQKSTLTSEGAIHQILSRHGMK